MSAQVHTSEDKADISSLIRDRPVVAGAESKGLPSYVVKSMAFFEAVGLGPKSDWKKTFMFILLYSVPNLLPSFLIGGVLGNFRYALYSLIGGIALIGDFVGMIALNRLAPSSTPWVHLVEHDSLETLKENFVPIALFAGVWFVAIIVFNVSFVQDECARRDLPSPSPGFYVGLCACYLAWPIHMWFDCFSNDFVGAATALEQTRFNKRVQGGEFSFEEAMREHKKQHRRHRAVISTMSVTFNITTAVFILSSVVYIYDYFVMSFSHWIFLVLFCMIMLSICIMTPLTWGAVNDNQDSLKVIITEMDEETKLDDAEAGFNKKQFQVWSTLQRTQFLVYLQAAELKVTTFGWPLGGGFVMEMILLYGSGAFLMWQVTTLSGFRGLSFDLSVA